MDMKILKCLLFVAVIGLVACAPASPDPTTMPAAAAPAQTSPTPSSLPTSQTPAPPTPAPTSEPEPEPTAEMTASKDNTDADPISVDPRLVSSYTEFGFDLFSEIAKRDAQENIFVSPLSVAVALAMTHNGASGETRDAMADILKLTGLTLHEVNLANAMLRGSLDDVDPKVELTIANSLWTRQGVEFRTEFLERNREFFEAEIASLDFESPTAPGTINQWVDTHTRGKIKRIVDKIDPDTVMYLINAIYFNGEWTVEFDKAKTKDMTFHLPGGGSKQHPMMFQAGKYLYTKNENFQAVSLPYGEGRVSMYIFLPSVDSNLTQFLGSLDAESWESWVSQFRTREGNVTLPRFKTEYEASLNEALKALGMGIAFDPGRADFDGMRPTPPNLFIQEVKHKAVVEVNEKGTEAAAVTSVTIGVTSARVEERFSLVADRPFFFAIRDNQTGSIIFMGTVINPEE